MDERLPEFSSPPVSEIIGSVQFPPLPSLGIREILEVGGRLEGYELTQLHPVLPPIQEGASDQRRAALMVPWLFVNQQPPQRALFTQQGEGARFIVQLQNDRVAVNETRAGGGADQSSEHVWPELARALSIVQDQLVEGKGYGPQAANLVELSYTNVVRGKRLDEVLLALSGDYAGAGRSDVENVSVSFSFPQLEDGRFVGRVYVQAGPALVDDEPVLQVQLVARRLVDRDAEVAGVYEACHRDAVETFASVTTVEAPCTLGEDSMMTIAASGAADATPTLSVRSATQSASQPLARPAPGSSQRASVLVAFSQDLDELVTLRDDWDSYGASAPDRTALEVAWRIVSEMPDAGSTPQVFPTRRGGVQLEWHRPKTTLEWEIDPGGATGVFVFDNHETGQTLDGEYPAQNAELAAALAQVLADR